MTAEKLHHHHHPNPPSSSSSSPPSTRHPTTSTSTSASKRPKHPDTSAGASPSSLATSPARKQKPSSHSHPHSHPHSHQHISNVTTPPKAAVATAAKRLGEMVGVGVGVGVGRGRGERDRDRDRDVEGMTMGRKTRSPRRVRRDENATGAGAGAGAGAEEHRGGDDGNEGENGELGLVAAKERIRELEAALRVARGEVGESKGELSVGLGQRQSHTRAGAGAGDAQHAERPRSARSNMSVDTSATSHTHDYDYDYDIDGNPNPHISLLNDTHLLQTHTHTHPHLQHQAPPPEDSPHPTPASWHALTARLHATEKQSQQRLAHLLSLKSTISALTRPAAQATDSDLAERLAQLGNRAREWVVRNFRRARLRAGVLDMLPEETKGELRGVLLDLAYLEMVERLALLQAVVASVMMRIFEEVVVVGLPGEGPLAALREVAGMLRAAEDYRGWRHAMIRCLQGSGEASGELQLGRERLVRGLVLDVLNHLNALTAVGVAADARVALEGIFADAAELQNVLLLQKAEYQVRFYRPRRGLVGHDGDGGGGAAAAAAAVIPTEFDAARMEAVNELDDEEGVDADGDVVVAQRVVTFCVFPGLEKFGDEFGEHEEVRNILVRARVCCESGA